MKVRLILFLLVLGSFWNGLSAQNNLHFAPGVLDKIKGLQVHCAGQAVEGGVPFSVVGGVPPYAYTLTLNNKFVNRGELSRENESRVVTVLTGAGQSVGVIAGTYELVIRDSKGCTLKHRFGISEPEAIRIVSHVTNPGKLTGDDGAIRLVGISGGLPGGANMPYKINWYMDMGGRNVAIPGSENKMILSDLRAGNYVVKVSDYSMPECSIESSFTLTTPPQLLGSHTIVSPILCNSQNDRSATGSLNRTGALRAVASGGKPPYTYKWYDNNGNGRLLQAGHNPEIRNLGPGVYSVDIEDANNHNYTVCCINLEEPAPITITRSYPINNSYWDACTTYGTIVFDVNARRYDNLKAYSYYHINNPQAQNKGPEVITNLQQSGNRLTLFQPGEYYIIVEDHNGCRAEGPKTVVNTLECLSCCNYPGSTGFSEPIQNFRVTQQNPCINGLGSIAIDEVRHVTATTLKNDFNGRYRFEILNLDGTPYFIPGIDSFRNATGEFRNLEGGRAYVVSAFDRISRTRFYRSFNIPYNTFYFDTLNGYSPVVAHPVTCNDRNDGRIQIRQAPIQNQDGSIYECLECMYEIREFNTDRIVFRTTPGGSTPAAQISSFLLPAGDYRLCVLPPNNSTDPRFECLRASRYCYHKRLSVSQPRELELRATAEKTTICSPSVYGVPTTNINVEVKGGMPPYNVSLYQNNMLVPPYRTPLVNPVGADRVYTYSFPVVSGNYTIELVDENGCARNASLSIANFPIVRLAAQQGGGNCYDVVESGGVVLQGGHISLAASGGRPSYLVEVFDYWENETRTFPISEVQGIRVPALAGLYTVKGYDSNDINDARGCVNNNFTRVKISLNPQLNICHTITEKDEKRRIDLTVSGGVAPYSYRWSNNAATPYLDIDNLDIPSSYSVTVTDANNCARTESFVVSSLDELAAGSDKLVLYPNPAQSSLQIAANWPSSGKNVIITLMNAMGQIVQNTEFSSSEENINLDVASLTNGVYIVKVNAGGKQWVQSFIKN
jgi:hypothetical protein